MSEKKELNIEELEKVTGGATTPKSSKYKVGKQLGQYETANYIGKEVVVYASGTQCSRTLVYGTLKDSFEDSWGCGTRRCCLIDPRGEYNHDLLMQDGYPKAYVDTNPVYLIDEYY